MKLDLWTIILFAATLLLGGCAGNLTSSGALKAIPETIKEGAQTYQEVRPQVIELRQQAIDNWDKVPEKAKPLLIKIDKEILPRLDEFGQKLVLASDIINGINQAKEARLSIKNVDWDEALSVVLKAAGTVVSLKAQGAF
jgi:hypothetical protein